MEGTDVLPEGATQIVGNRATEELLGSELRKPVEELEQIKELAANYTHSPIREYVLKIESLIRVWADKYNPQVTPGIQIPLDQRFFADAFEGINSVWGPLSTETKSQAIELVRIVLETELRFWSQNPNSDIIAHNNRTSYSNLTGIEGALLLRKAGEGDGERYLNIFLLGDPQANVMGYYEQVRQSVAADGSSIDFRYRDSVHYHVFNQIAWEKSRRLLNANGIQIPTDVEQKLDDSLTFAMRFIHGGEDHLEFVASQHARDKQVNASKIGVKFDPQSAVARELLKIVNAELL
jgi:hypothetical protein